MAEAVVRRITATPEDVARYKACRLEMLADEPLAYGVTYEQAVARPQSFWTGRVREGSDGDRYLLLIAETKKSVVGSFGAEIDEDGICWIIGVWVHEQHRGSGLAQQFLERIEEWARESGATKLMLHVNNLNERAHRFYEREGFTPTGERKASETFPGTYELEMQRSF